MQKKGKKARPEKLVSQPDGIHAMHLSAAQRIAFMFEKAKFAEYVDMMQKPMRFAWLNFWGGVWRGVGMAIGASIVSVIVIFFAVKGLNYMFQHAGGVPWIGENLKEGVGWLLDIVKLHQNTDGK